MVYKIEIEGTPNFLSNEMELTPEELETVVKVFNKLEERGGDIGTPSLSIYELINGKQELIF